jgi:sugar phosphate isomerase/epimerase
MPSLLCWILTTTLAFILASGAPAALPGAGPGPAFFAFDNGVGREQKWAPEKQAAVLKELGYAGIGYTGVDDLAARQAAFQSAGLRIFSLYVAAHVDRPDPFTPRLMEALPRLAGTGTQLWLTVNGKSPNDERAVALVRELADAAARHGVRVVLYPHKGFFVATADDALRILEQVQRPNVGLTINLCHELAAGNADRMGDLAKICAPHLELVSINGADRSGGWNELIRPLDEGAFDVAAFLRQLDQAGYRGPIGLQCYNLKGDPEALLRRSIAAWRKLTAQR